MAESESLNSVELATELTIAWLGNQNTRVNADEVPTFFQKMLATVQAAATTNSSGSDATSEQSEAPEYTPAVTVRKSLASKDFILSLIDGKPYKTLKRHLAGHGLTPQDYRQRYGLKADYPMVAPSYSEHRRSVAVKLGLGQKGRHARTEAASSEAAAKPASPAPAPAKRAKAAAAPAPAAKRGKAAAAPAQTAAAPAPAKRATRGRKASTASAS